MRVSLVTETYFPQVNGVSRTLGQLVRHLTARGDAVQLVHPGHRDPVQVLHLSTDRRKLHTNFRAELQNLRLEGGDAIRKLFEISHLALQ